MNSETIERWRQKRFQNFRGKKLNDDGGIGSRSRNVLSVQRSEKSDNQNSSKKQSLLSKAAVAMRRLFPSLILPKKMHFLFQKKDAKFNCWGFV